MGDSKPPQRQASQAERPQLWRTDGPRIGGGRQRPAPESAPATALMRAVRRAIDVADDPRHWDVAATYRGPGSRDPFELLQAHWPQTGHGIRTQGHAQERRRRGPANHTDHANASGRHARQCYSVRSPSEDEAEAEAVKESRTLAQGSPKRHPAQDVRAGYATSTSVRAGHRTGTACRDPEPGRNTSWDGPCDARQRRERR